MRTRATPMDGKDLRRIVLLWAYPALRQLPRSGWDEALEHAREMSFDTMEWMGIVVGVAFSDMAANP